MHRAVQSQAVQPAIDIARARLMLFERARAPVPFPILGVLVFWLTALFASFCLFTPVNRAASASLVMVTLSASAALFLILEMGQAFAGLMEISRRTLSTVLPLLTA